MPQRIRRLLIESLEDRSTPSSTPLATESFDGLSPASLPTDWQTWAANGNAGFTVSMVRSIDGGALSSSGGSTLSGRAWIQKPFAANVVASASIFADTLIPIQIAVRGTSLDSPTPSYYAVSIARGIDVRLWRVVNGVATELKSLQSTTYLSGQWLDVSLIAKGNILQVRVQRRDTGTWLTPTGDWIDAPAAAITIRDSAIATGGNVGVVRATAYAGTAYLDELRVTNPVGDFVPPLVTAAARPVSRRLTPTTVAGIARFVTSIRDSSRITTVDYVVDGELVARKSSKFFAHDFDTRNLANGLHSIAIRVRDAAGNYGEATATFTVFNIALSLPAIPRHYNHIRFASLGYNGLVLGQTEESLLRNSVDLVVPHSRYLQQIDALSPSTPQLIYSNFSNLYLDLITDWLAYADKARIPRESAFYHVSEPTAFSGDSPSSMPVTWFWNVQRSGTGGFTRLTSAAQSSAIGDIVFPQLGQAIYIGHPDRFREINIAISRGAETNWRAIIEYPQRVDARGNVVTWKAIKVIGDGTAGFHQSGAITFDPPRDWKSAIVEGSTAPLMYVRIRTVSGTADEAPIASTILGHDYVGARGGRSGIIPAFDSSADADRDGYLSEAEYARRKPGFDARFIHESRLFYPYYGQMRFLTNPSGGGVAAWAIAYHRQLLQSQPLADGIFMDNSGGQVAIGDEKLLESIESYSTDFGAVLGAINRAIAPKWIIANTSGGGASGERVARHVPATIEEFALRPLAHNWAQFRDLASAIDRRLQSIDAGYLILDSLSQGGSPTDERTRMSALAYYYLLADDSTFFMTWGGEEPASAWSRHWFDAIAFDVGRPMGDWSQFANGADPSSPALSYEIFQRTYEDALVLYKPLSYAPGKGTGTNGNGTATTHLLNGSYRQLQADGTLGLPSTTVTLRNGEGAILVRA